MSLSSYHTHSVYSDGKNTLEEMVQSAIEKGCSEIGFSDHAPMAFRCDWSTSKEKIERFFDFFLGSVLDEKSWHVKVWAREVLAPSSFVKQVLSEQALPKISVVMKIFSEYTGLAEDDPKLYTCYFSAMSPLMMGVFIRRNNMEEIAPHIGNAARQTKLIKEFIFAGLDNFKVK